MYQGRYVMCAFILSWQVDGRRQTYMVTADRRCLIGSEDGTCDIVLQFPTVSHQHAAISRAGETFYLCNISKRNSILVNELTRVGPGHCLPLKLADSFRVGPIAFHVLEALNAPAAHFRLQCAHCHQVIDDTPEAFCPWCGRALTNGDTVRVKVTTGQVYQSQPGTDRFDL